MYLVLLINTDLFSDVKDNSFSRSRSSSVTSIDKESREAISALHFGETFTRKADTSPSPCLWVGTTLGTVLVIVLNLPPGGEQRLLQPVIVSPSGEYKADGRSSLLSIVVLRAFFNKLFLNYGLIGN